MQGLGRTLIAIGAILVIVGLLGRYFTGPNLSSGQ
jgi:hypothetical protein